MSRPSARRWATPCRRSRHRSVRHVSNAAGSLGPGGRCSCLPGPPTGDHAHETQLVELQGHAHTRITGQGLGLIAVSYDSPETLKKFSDSRGITFPMVSDPGSAIIKRYGLLNETMDPKSRFYGVPHPGTFILDARGVVVSRFFEDAYQERYTAATILSSMGVDTSSGTVSAATAHLSLSASISDRTAAPGERLSVVVNVTPRPGMHLYAPGKHDYQVVQLTFEPQPWLKLNDTVYPPSEIFHFVPLDERVEVYEKPFRLQRDVTLLATPEAQKQLGAMSEITLSGALEYQACDDKICFNPTRVPISFTLQLKQLDRRPPGQ
ncbi:MAG: redoxin domain-containing protein [Vicinamibacterales bacterium]